MQFAFRRICSLISSDANRLKPCLSRHFSTFENFDAYPVSNAIWHSREVDMKDLGDPVNFFGRNRMFDSILYNKLVGRPKSKDGREINPYLAKIIKMNPRMVSEIFAYALRSLAVITVENHRMGVPLGAAVKLSNLRISYSHGKFVLLNILPKSPGYKGLTLQQRCNDWIAIRDLVKQLVEEVCGSGVQYPVDFAHWLEKLGEPQPQIFMILYHTVFLRSNARFYYHVSLDQFCRKEPRGKFNIIMNDSELRELLREIGDLRELLNLAELNEFLKCCIAGDDGTQAAASKYPKGGQPSNGTGQQGQAPPATGQQSQAPPATGQQGQAPPATGQQGQAPPATGQQSQPSQATGQQGQPAARGGQSQTFNSSNAPPQGQPSQAQGNSIPQGQALQTQDPYALLQQARLKGGHTLVAVHRNSPVHGCQKTCVGFSFIQRSMLNRGQLFRSSISRSFPSTIQFLSSSARKGFSINWTWSACLVRLGTHGNLQ